MKIISLTSTGLTIDDRTQRYVEKTIEALERLLPARQRATARVTVHLNRVDREHGNKYEATVSLVVGTRTVTATDSTLNVLAALDIVRAKLATELKK